ncbi:MAG: hypothetical protein AAF702_39005 [Chloroflexota bacterium]
MTDGRVIDERIFLVIAPALILWLIMMPSQRNTHGDDYKLYVGRIVAQLAGSKTDIVNGRIFALQLGDASMIIWYVAFRISASHYLADNAYFLSILAGGLSGLILQKILRLLGD